jgi:Holliday junction resolvase RusA-like endonuclease
MIMGDYDAGDMKHNRHETPAYLIWVEERPTMNGKGKQVYYDAVQAAARLEIANPITSDDIKIEIAYATSVKRDERKDVDNVNKPTLDALEGVAYLNDRQVRSVTSTIFDKNMLPEVEGRAEYMGRLFYPNKPHVLLIRIYSDTRLAELGGEQEVQRRRYVEWQRNFDEWLARAKGPSAQ